MNDSIQVQCPSCQHQFDLNDAMRGQLDERVNALVSAQVSAEKDAIRADAADKAAKKATEEMAATLKEAQDELSEKKAALAESRELEAELRKERRDLEEAKAALQTEVQRQVDAELGPIRERAQKKADEHARLVILSLIHI